ncbi:MAG: hypothetical protein KC503_12110 [Myxococcales bacterium]|nr:hypothetical protein [Myxococcales bacterium]
MTALGPNIKLTIARDAREPLRAAMTEVFGATHASPRDDFDVYTLGDGSHLGAYCVDAALAAESAKLGAWIELVVDDVAAARAALARRGIEPFEYFDKEHDYIQLPGGQVVRLAATEARR